MNSMTRGFEVRSNKEIYIYIYTYDQFLFGEPNITGVLRAKRLSWLGRVLWCNSIAGEVLNWKPQGKRPLGRPKQRLSDNDTKYLSINGAGYYN